MDGQGEDVTYNQVETALATIFKVSPKEMGAFRARLRHLRNIGLPHLPTPGSGRRIDYSERHALEMLIAIAMEKFGYSPKNAAIVAQSIVRQSPYGQHMGKDCFIIISKPDYPGYTQAMGRMLLAKVLKSAPDLVLVMNLSSHVRRLQPALERVMQN
jgi:hypothetical protein